MQHAFMYAGGYERNFAKQSKGATTFEGSDGQQHNLATPPASVNGLRVYFMEKPGKKFSAVRIADEKDDVVLEHDVLLIPGQHFGLNVRLAAEPTVIQDDALALKLLEDITLKNRNSSEELLRMRARLKAGAAQS